jgi:2,5-diketo-D-gluconate reductase B
MTTQKDVERIDATTKLEGIMPVIGFGTWEIIGSSCTESVQHALEIGYRHIDTAQMYHNEEEVGTGIKKSGVNREEIFVTTKIATSNLEPSLIRSTTDESLHRLDMEYVDLLLIHWPTPGMDLKACLETMFDLREKGKIKHVGVSNFGPDMFKKALEMGPVVNNQVKFTTYKEQFHNLDIAKQNDVTITAYSPLERGDITEDDVLSEVGKKYNKTASQVELRWLIQLGNVSVIPKAESANHRQENFNIFDFELTDDDMKRIQQLG